MRTNLSPHFTRKENKCRCGCNKYGADIELVDVLEWLRKDLRDNVHAGAVIHVHSWFRCREHNNRPKTEQNSLGVFGAGSNDNSWHPGGGAVDCSSPQVPHAIIAKRFRLKFPSLYGLGLYNWGVHLDVREQVANWDNTSIHT